MSGNTYFFLHMQKAGKKNLNWKLNKLLSLFCSFQGKIKTQESIVFKTIQCIQLYNPLNSHIFQKMTLACYDMLIKSIMKSQIKSRWRIQLYGLPCSFCSFRTKRNFEWNETVCKDYNCCHMIIPEKDNNILKYDQGKQFLKTPFIVYEDIVYEWGHSLFTQYSFDSSKSTHNFCRNSDCM